MGSVCNGVSLIPLISVVGYLLLSKVASKSTESVAQTSDMQFL